MDLAAGARAYYNKFSGRKKQVFRTHKKPIQKLKKKVARIQKSIVGEYRYKLTAIGAYSAPQNGLPQLINGMQVGDLDGTRSANQIRMWSITGYFAFAANPVTMIAAAGATSNLGVRLLIVYDKQTNGAAPSVNEMLMNNGFAANNHCCPQNPRFKQQYRILYDKLINPILMPCTYAAPGANIQNAPLRYVRFRINLKGLPVYYIPGNNVGDVTDIDKGSIQVFTFASDANSFIQVNEFNVLLKYTP